MTINTNKVPKLSGILVVAIYCTVIAVVMVQAYRKPEYNWDMLAYMAVVISADQHQVHEIHRETYAAARDHIPPFYFQQLVNPSNTYRKTMYESDTAFYRQLPFYVVKPLYTALVRLAWRAGFSLPAATVIPSIAAYFGIALLLLIWFLHYLPPPYAGGTALLILLSAPLLTISGLSTPDALSAFLLLGVFYFSVERPRLLLLILFMAGALLARLDNIIVCILIVFFMAISKKPPFGMRLPGYAALFLGMTAVYFLVARQATAFGFDILYYPSFIRYMNLPHQYTAVFSWSAYWQVLSSVAVTGLYHSALALFGFLALLLFYEGRYDLRELSFNSWMPLLFFLIVVIRFVLVPDISDRFYIPYYLLIAALLVKNRKGKDRAIFKTGK